MLTRFNSLSDMITNFWMLLQYKDYMAVSDAGVMVNLATVNQ